MLVGRRSGFLLKQWATCSFLGGGYVKDCKRNLLAFLNKVKNGYNYVQYLAFKYNYFPSDPSLFLRKSTRESHRTPPTQKTNESQPLILLCLECLVMLNTKNTTTSQHQHCHVFFIKIIQIQRGHETAFFQPWDILIANGFSDLPQKFHGLFFGNCQVALQDPSLISVFDALEISVEDAWNLFRTLDSDPWIRKKKSRRWDRNKREKNRWGKKDKKRTKGSFWKKCVKNTQKVGHVGMSIFQTNTLYVYLCVSFSSLEDFFFWGKNHHVTA